MKTCIVEIQNREHVVAGKKRCWLELCIKHLEQLRSLLLTFCCDTGSGHADCVESAVINLAEGVDLRLYNVGKLFGYTKYIYLDMDRSRDVPDY